MMKRKRQYPSAPSLSSGSDHARKDRTRSPDTNTCKIMCHPGTEDLAPKGSSLVENLEIPVRWIGRHMSRQTVLLRESTPIAKTSGPMYERTMHDRHASKSRGLFLRRLNERDRLRPITTSATSISARDRRGFTRQPENSKRAHFTAPALQTPPKFHERTPREVEE